MALLPLTVAYLPFHWFTMWLHAAVAARVVHCNFVFTPQSCPEHDYYTWIGEDHSSISNEGINRCFARKKHIDPTFLAENTYDMFFEPPFFFHWIRLGGNPVSPSAGRPALSSPLPQRRQDSGHKVQKDALQLTSTSGKDHPWSKGC